MSRLLKRNWILEYSEAMAKISEAPTQFNIWAAISAIGTVLKRNVYFKRSTYEIFPNNYIIFVSPPGIGKGSAIRAVYDMVKDLNIANVINDRITAPRIIERFATGVPSSPTMVNGTLQMSVDSTGVIISLELPALISASDWMISFLCQSWDQNEFDYDTKNKGTNLIKGMCTSLAGACVPDYMRKLSKDATAVVTGGLAARSIFVFAEEIARKIIWPKPLSHTPAGKQLEHDLKEDLRSIARLRGEFKFTPEGIKTFEDFYNNLTIKQDDSDLVAHFKSRLVVHAIKVAMIFSVGERDDLTINDIDLINACTCLRHVTANLDRAFRGVGDSDIAEATARVQNLLERRKLITKAEILTTLHKHVSPETLDRVMSTLAAIKFCTCITLAGEIYYKVHTPVVIPQTGPANIQTANGGIKNAGPSGSSN